MTLATYKTERKAIDTDYMAAVAADYEANRAEVLADYQANRAAVAADYEANRADAASDYHRWDRKE